MSMELNLLMMKAKNERVYGEKNLCVAQRNVIDSMLTI